MSQLTVSGLWVIYVAALLILAIIFFFLASAGILRLSVGIFLAALLAGVLTYLVYFFNFDPAVLTENDWNTLQSLFIAGLIILGLSLLWVIFDAVNLGKKMKWGTQDESVKTEEPDCHKHIEAECDDDGCVIKSGSIHCDSDAGRAELDFECDDEGCFPTNAMIQKGEGTLNIKYIV